MGKFKPPKIHKYGRGVQECQRCGSRDAVIQAYGLYLCRQCFREVAATIGFKKYS
ncbi:30S ribosomal protein S14 [Thermosphaera sp.]|uniref:Small ribosomal subunit protein uS14 n=1 Tax=Thermosphaera aggregans TaxID=54254 RepID=A0A7C2BKG8_9CREN